MELSHFFFWAVIIASGVFGLVMMAASFLEWLMPSVKLDEKQAAKDLDEKYPLEDSCRVVTDKLLNSFSEGLTIDPKSSSFAYRTLGNAIEIHWRYLSAQGKCKVLTSDQRLLLKTHPAVFFSNAHASEQFDRIVRVITNYEYKEKS